MTSITVQQPYLLVIEFDCPLTSCTTHLLPKANLAQAFWVLSKINPSGLKAIYLYGLHDYLTVYLTFNIDLFKLAITLP